MRGYKDLVCVLFDDSTFSWGGTDYSHILIDSGDSIPTNISTTNRVDNTYSSILGIISGTKTYTFISPDVWDVVSEMDGVASGTFRIYVAADGAVSAYSRITAVTITLNAIDNDGNSRELASDTVWEGTFEVTGNDSDYLAVMYWISITKQKIDYNERLELVLEFDYEINDQTLGGTFTVGFSCAYDDVDMKISLPFIA
jgi:hypothetical protein